jgi:hypothetical protein
MNSRGMGINSRERNTAAAAAAAAAAADDRADIT